MSEEDIRHLADEAEEFNPNTRPGPLPPRQQPIHGSDVDIATCVRNNLVSEFGCLVFCEGYFWYYDQTHWRQMPEHELQLAVQQYDGFIIQTPLGSSSVIKLNDNRVRSIIKQMAPALTNPRFFDEAEVGINCMSGFIRFQDDGASQIEPHNPEHRCRNVLKGKWCGTSELELACAISFSTLGSLLEGVFRGDSDAEDKVALLQEIAGAAALGYGTKLREPKAVILEGKTAENGKSQILDLFRSLLPEDAISSVPASKMGDERFLPNLIGKHLNATDELSSASAIASDTFKAIITGEPVTGREVYCSAVTFRPIAQHVFCTNALPSFSGGIDRGVQRRLLIVSFNRIIPKEERIEHIGQRIAQQEPDLVLAWAVEGASRLIRQRRFTVPSSSDAALREWFYTADPVLGWTRACVTAVDPQSAQWEEARIKSRDAYHHFRIWAVAEGYMEKALPALNGFVQRLRSTLPAVQPKHTNKGNWLFGLQIDPVSEDAGPRGAAGLFDGAA